MKLEQWVVAVKEMAEDLAPIKLQSPIQDKPESFVSPFQTKTGAQWGIRFDFESNEPHRIIGVRVSPDPASLLEVRKVPDHSAYENLNDLAVRVVKSANVPAVGLATWIDGKTELGVSGIQKTGSQEPAVLSDRWLIGSIGKAMTATLVAIFIEEGKLDWDTKLGDILKDMPMSEGYRTVTIEQLMQHLSGLPQDQIYTAPDLERIMGKLEDPVKIRAAYAKDVLNRAPLSPPGERMAYSNAGYSLLGHIIERIAKKPFENVIHERLFTPLGMKSAICSIPGSPGMPSSTGQIWGHYETPSGPIPGKIIQPLVLLTAPAGGGFACNLEDLAKFGAMHLKGLVGESSGLLKVETIKRLHTPLPRKVGNPGYASGWVLTPEAHLHNGSDGTFNAELVLVPKLRLVAIGIANQGFSRSPTPGLEAVGAIVSRSKAKASSVGGR